MGITICINGRNNTQYPSTALDPDGRTTLQIIQNYTKQIDDIEDVYYLSQNGKCPDGFNWKTSECSSMIDFLTMAEKLPDTTQAILFIHNDTPLINKAITEQMIIDHKKYHAEYTFAEGYPVGYAPEILSRDGIIHMKNLLGDDKLSLTKGSLFELVSRDINTFDLETKISNKDMRSYRLTLGMETKLEFMQTSAIYQACIKKDPAVSEETLTEVITGQEELQRTIPAYVSIQITEGCPQKCTYCPYPKMNPGLLESRDTMSFKDYIAILDKLSDFMETGYINLSPFGDPSLHPEINNIVKMSVDKGFTVILETAGLGWDKEKVAELVEYCGDKLIWIISIDAIEPQLYKTMRGDGFEQAFSFAKHMIATNPEGTYVQCVRIKENEDALEPFFRFWKELTSNIIIQKFDYYCGYLPENVVTDISPVHRNVCWHLKRDLTIRMDGTVPLCKADVEMTNTIGNILKESLEDIWERAIPVYQKHIKKQYEGICKGCDEYYTYNF